MATIDEILARVVRDPQAIRFAAPAQDAAIPVIQKFAQVNQPVVTPQVPAESITPDVVATEVVNRQNQGPASRPDAFAGLIDGTQSPDDRAELIKKFNERFQQGVEQRQRDIDTLRGRIGEEQGKTPLDFSPFASFLSAQFGRQFSLPQGDTVQKRDARIDALQRSLSNQERALTQDEISLLKAQIGDEGKDLKIKLQREKAAGTQRRFDASKGFKAEGDIFNKVNKLNSSVQDDARSFNQLDSALERGDFQSVMSTLAVFARVVSGERGVLTDNDINRVIPRNIQGDSAKIRSYFSNTPSADITPKFVKNLRELVSIAKNKSAQQHLAQSKLIRKGVNTLSKFKSARPQLGLFLDEFDKGVTEALGSQVRPKKTTTDKRKRLEELRRKKAGR